VSDICVVMYYGSMLCDIVADFGHWILFIMISMWL